MTLLTPFDLDTAFVHPEAPSFAALVERLAQAEGLSAERRRDLTSGLRRLAKALGRSVEEVPADPRWLRPRIAKVAPIAIGLSAKSWTNVRSDARAAMAQCGVVERRNHRRVHLSPEWSRLWTLVLASRDTTLQPSLYRFVQFVNRRGVAPEEVDEGHAAAYREALEHNEIAREPETAWCSAVSAWNRAVARLPEWPRRSLSLPSRRNPIVLLITTFPASFRADLDRYVDDLTHPDPLDADARLVGMRPSSVKQRRLEVVRFASALVRGGEPAESLIDLAALVEPERADRGLRWLLARAGSHKTHVIARAAEMLRHLARGYVKVDGTVQATFDRYVRKLAMPVQQGMRPKNRDRLRQLDDPAALRRLLLLPERLKAAADALGSAHKAQLWREDAVAVAILLACPVRVGNLSRIHLERNLQRPGGGRVFLVFEAEEVKNGRRIEFELPRGVVDLIDRHLALRSPGLCPRGTPWLFPRRGGPGPIGASHLSTKVCRTIRRETGVTMNMHLFRHLAARLWLDAHPGEYEALRRILGHSALSSTLNAYAGFEAGTATRLYAEVVEAARRA